MYDPPMKKTMTEAEAVRLLASIGGRCRSAKQTAARQANGRKGGQRTSAQVQEATELLGKLRTKPTPDLLKRWLKVSSRTDVRANWQASFGKAPPWL